MVGDKNAEEGSTFWLRVNLFHCKECGKPGGISFAGSQMDLVWPSLPQNQHPNPLLCICQALTPQEISLEIQNGVWGQR